MVVRAASMRFEVLLHADGVVEALLLEGGPVLAASVVPAAVAPPRPAFALAPIEGLGGFAGHVGADRLADGGHLWVVDAGSVPHVTELPSLAPLAAGAPGTRALRVGERRLEARMWSSGRLTLRLLDGPPPDEDDRVVAVLGGRSVLPLRWDSPGQRLTGRLRGVRPKPGGLRVRWVTGDGARVGRTWLDRIATTPADLDELPDLRLELPELGSSLPERIEIRPGEDAAAAPDAP